MNKYLPDIYKKDIFSINYIKLKERGIKAIIFDLDNTLALIDAVKIDQKTKRLINDLKKNFIVLLVSNSKKERVALFKDDLGLDAYHFALKPLTISLKKIKKKYNLNNNEIAMVGDQFITDMGYAHNGKILKIFVDNLGVKDLKVTSINRYFEQKIMSKYLKKGLFKKGTYYESR